jgi:hypothetical protein
MREVSSAIFVPLAVTAVFAACGGATTGDDLTAGSTQSAATIASSGTSSGSADDGDKGKHHHRRHHGDHDGDRDDDHDGRGGACDHGGAPAPSNSVK